MNRSLPRFLCPWLLPLTTLTLLAPVSGCGSGEDAPDEPPPTPDVVAVVDAGPGLAENFGQTETEGHADCEGLSDEHCLLPFPSDRFRDTDGAIRFGAESLPEQADGKRMDALLLEGHDGFSPITPILIRMEGATLKGAPPVTDIAQSLEPNSPTVLLDASSGERVAHWVELDHFTVAAEKPVITIRPAVRLAFSRRYIVAVRGLENGDGEVLPAPKGFRTLRDGVVSTVKGIHARRPHFDDDIFPTLSEAGVARDDLQLAFDFTTASRTSTTRTLLAMREQLLETIGAAGPTYVVDEVETPENHASIATILHCTAQVPSFLLPAEGDARRLRLGEDGLPVHEGFEAVAFTVQIPHSVAQSGKAAPILQYGHGLFGAKTEANNGWLRDMANRLGFVILAADMMGLSESDIGVWGVELTQDVSAFAWLWEKPMQGLVNHLALARLATGKLASDTAEIDGARTYYYGNSQGGTMGTVLMALNQDIERGVLGVPGAAYALLLNRSTAFAQFSAILTLPYPDPVDFAAAFGVMQTGFNRLEPLSYVDFITAEPLPGAPTHRVLLHVAKEDSQVVNDVSFLLGRSIGVVSMSPAVRSVWGLSEKPYPVTENALVEYDFNKPDNPEPTKPPPAKHDTHGDLRKLQVAQDQLWTFLETGEVTAVCDGVCDPE